MGILDQARDLRGSIRKIVEDVIKNDPRFMRTWQVQRAVVTSAASLYKMGVKLAGETASVYLPYSVTVKDATIGQSVYVAMIGGRLSNAIVWDYADFGVPVVSVLKTVSGNPISINDAAGGYATAVTIDFPLTQLGSGAPSDNNVRKIVGSNTLNLDVNGTTISIPLQISQDVFAGGSFNVLNGSLTVTHGVHNFTGSESGTSLSGSGNSRYFYYNLGDLNFAVNSTDTANGWCSHLPNAEISSSTTDPGYKVLNSSTANKCRQAFRKTELTTAAQYRTWMSGQNSNGTPVQGAFTLTTPQTYTQTTHPVILGTGANTITASLGNDVAGVITMSYYAYQ